MGIRTKFNPMGGLGYIYTDDKQFFAERTYGYAFKNKDELRMLLTVKGASLDENSTVYRIMNVQHGIDFVCLANAYKVAGFIYLDKQNILKAVVYPYTTNTTTVSTVTTQTIMDLSSYIGTDEVLLTRVHQAENNNDWSSTNTNNFIFIYLRQKILKIKFAYTPYSNPKFSTAYTTVEVYDGYYPINLLGGNRFRLEVDAISISSIKYSFSEDKIYNGTTRTELGFYKKESRNPTINSNGTYGAGVLSLSASVSYAYQMFDGNFDSSPQLSSLNGIYYPNTILKKVRFYINGHFYNDQITIYGKLTSSGDWIQIYKENLSDNDTKIALAQLSNSTIYNFYKITSSNNSRYITEIQLIGEDIDRTVYDL